MRWLDPWIGGFFAFPGGDGWWNGVSTAKSSWYITRIFLKSWDIYIYYYIYIWSGWCGCVWKMMDIIDIIPNSGKVDREHDDKAWDRGVPHLKTVEWWNFGCQIRWSEGYTDTENQRGIYTYITYFPWKKHLQWWWNVHRPKDPSQLHSERSLPMDIPPDMEITCHRGWELVFAIGVCPKIGYLLNLRLWPLALL